jgi:hypothetical protein
MPPKIMSARVKYSLGSWKRHFTDSRQYTTGSTLSGAVSIPAVLMNVYLGNKPCKAPLHDYQTRKTSVSSKAWKLCGTSTDTEHGYEWQTIARY